MHMSSSDEEGLSGVVQEQLKLFIKRNKNLSDYVVTAKRPVIFACCAREA